jgi:hypothetical protein
MNQFSDLTSEEFAQMHLGDNGAEEIYSESETRRGVEQALTDAVVPIDWR